MRSLERLLKRPVVATFAGLLAVALVLIICAYSLPNGLTFGVVLQGLVFGFLTSLTTAGLILTYKAFKVINFAQAEIGGLASSVAILTVTGAHMNYFEGVALGLLTAAFTGAAIDLLVMRRFTNAPRLNVTVATIGLAQLLGAAELALPNLFAQLKPLSTFSFPAHVTFTVGYVTFDANSVAALVAAPLVLLALAGFLYRTRFGTAIRAIADSRERAASLGVPVGLLGLISWIVIALLSGLSSVLTTPILGQNINAVAGPEALLIPLAAAVIAGMQSLFVGFLASLALGLFEEIVRWSTSNASIVDLGVFIAIVLGLLFSYARTGREQQRAADEYSLLRYPRPVPTPLLSLPEIRWGRPALLLAAGVAGIVLPTLLPATSLSLASFIVIYVLIAASLVVISGWAGQVSLGQFAFVGIGASLAGVMLTHTSANLIFVGLACLALGAAVAVLVGIPSLRLPGFLLAAATLGFAVPISTYFLNADNFPGLTPSVVPRPVFLSRIDLNDVKTFYVFCAVIAVLVLWALRNLADSRWGRAIIAVRENPDAASALGIAPFAYKVGAFALSGAVAALAGALYVEASRGIQFNGFSPEESLVVFTMAVFGGLGSLTGAVIGAVYVESILYYVSGAWQLFATGAGLLLVLMVVPEGLGRLVFLARDRVVSAVTRLRKIDLSSLYQRLPLIYTPEASTDPAHEAALKMMALEELEATAPSMVKAASEAPPVLSCEELTVLRGGSVVLSNINLEVGDSEIVAVVGTNGAGKTTLLRTISGLNSPKEGRLFFLGQDITKASPQRRFRMGIGFVQGPLRLFLSLSVLENLEMGGWHLPEKRLRRRIAEVLEIFPALKNRLHITASNLSGGERQMLALAQALISEPRLLLIDELSMGLAPKAVAELISSVRDLVRKGMTILLVEQSINVASAVASQAVFIERGKIRFSGRTRDLSQMPELLRSVFLRAAARSALKAVELRGLSYTGAQVMALEATRISKSYGGLKALNEVSIGVGLGEVVGVIGANGAGKTTLVDVLSGMVKPDEGVIRLKGRRINHLSPAQRASLGIGRVFQLPSLFASMTVRDALMVAIERTEVLTDPLAYALASPDALEQKRELLEKTIALLSEYGLTKWLDHFVMELSTGTKRILELVCALARSPSIILLDEPSTGIAQRESEALAELLIGINRSRRVSMLIIEHDVPLVAQVANRLVCLHLGSVIAEGSVSDVLNDEAVIESYLGEEEAAIMRSGSLR